MSLDRQTSREAIRVERAGRGLLRLRLARPERGNAMNAAMLRELSEELSSAERDPAVRLIVLRGEGKHFCGGADIGGAKAPPGGSAAPKLSDLLLQLDRFPKPTVAFVQGACIGAALALVSCCDLAIAAPDAFFSIPEVRLGMMPGLLPFFIRGVGYKAFRRYGLSGERFGPEPAMRSALIGEIASVETWDELESRLLDSFLHAAPMCLAEIKREAARYADVAIGPELFESQTRHDSAEAEEGKASFKEKRKPNWYVSG